MMYAKLMLLPALYADDVNDIINLMRKKCQRVVDGETQLKIDEVTSHDQEKTADLFECKNPNTHEYNGKALICKNGEWKIQGTEEKVVDLCTPKKCQRVVDGETQLKIDEVTSHGQEKTADSFECKNSNTHEYNGKALICKYGEWKIQGTEEKVVDLCTEKPKECQRVVNGEMQLKINEVTPHDQEKTADSFECKNPNTHEYNGKALICKNGEWKMKGTEEKAVDLCFLTDCLVYLEYSNEILVQNVTSEVARKKLEEANPSARASLVLCKAADGEGWESTQFIDPHNVTGSKGTQGQGKAAGFFKYWDDKNHITRMVNKVEKALQQCTYSASVNKDFNITATNKMTFDQGDNKVKCKKDHATADGSEPEVTCKGTALTMAKPCKKTTTTQQCTYSASVNKDFNITATDKTTFDQGDKKVKCKKDHATADGSEPEVTCKGTALTMAKPCKKTTTTTTTTTTTNATTTTTSGALLLGAAAALVALV